MPIVESADALHDVLYPPNGVTLPRYSRIQQSENCAKELTRSLVEHSEQSDRVTDQLVFAAGVYCAARAYRSLAQADQVDQETAYGVTANFNQASEYFLEKGRDWTNDSDVAGAIGEFVVLSVIWNGIADQAIEGYAFMARSPHFGEKKPGLRSDFDIVGKLDSSRQKLQVKLDPKKESYIYEHGITVISPASIAGLDKRKSIRSLLLFGVADLSYRYEAYQRLKEYL